MAIVVVFSTMSFTINKHYCGEMLVDVAINKKAKTCGMEMMASSEDALSIKPCCHDEHIAVLGQDKLKKSLDTSIEFSLAVFALTKNLFLFDSFQETALFIAVGNHDPPDKAIDFQILYQTYLI